MSARTAVTRIIGTIHRLRACVSDHMLLFRGAYELMIVYMAQGCSSYLFQKALAAVGRKFSEPIWFAICDFIHTVSP